MRHSLCRWVFEYPALVGSLVVLCDRLVCGMRRRLVALLQPVDRPIDRVTLDPVDALPGEIDIQFLERALGLLPTARLIFLRIAIDKFRAEHRVFEPRERLPLGRQVRLRSEEHTSELKSLMRNSYAVFCLKKKNQ